MPQAEFSIIEKYFAGIGSSQWPPELPSGDDAAILEIPEGKQAVMSVDTLIAGVHFPLETSPADIAHKSLAVNLSDLAAMGASPAWFLLSLTIPDTNESWLDSFSASLRKIAEQYRIELVGGDTCHGPLSITIQVTGLVDKDKYITRSSANPGDLILVSGQIGNAALGLAHLQNRIQLEEKLIVPCLEAVNRPTPRLCLTDFLRNFANAAIDLSDGLVGDLKHILDKSKVGASISQDALPVNEWIVDNDAYEYALSGGDDYELCLTISPGYKDQIMLWNQKNPDCQLHLIGQITESGFYLHTENETIDLSNTKGYQHFGK
ncbi:MAG: thiamine-phosphate kinase [Gammaproteobacteria bacterium]|nr:thiamine-phosphate kinase [Gammaproteobacteria bacterium]